MTLVSKMALFAVKSILPVFLSYGSVLLFCFVLFFSPFFLIVAFDKLNMLEMCMTFRSVLNHDKLESSSGIAKVNFLNYGPEENKHS